MRISAGAVVTDTVNQSTKRYTLLADMPMNHVRLIFIIRIIFIYLLL